jgi:hypothetical protein
MALANTTLAAAATSTDKQFTVASATNLAAGLYGDCDGETVQITKGYTTGSVTVPVLRGQDGTSQIAHPTGAQIQWYGLPTDLPATGAQLSVSSPMAGRGRYVSSVTTSAAWTPATGNQDELVIINGTSVVALTLTNPLRSQTGKVVTFAGNGKAAHTITYTTVGFGDIGATADVLTFHATMAQSIDMIAVGGFWLLKGQVAGAASVAGVGLG